MSSNDTPTIARGKWSEEEHARFENAIQTYGKDWKKVTEAVMTREPSQVRSHAQKYFEKLDKQAKYKSSQNPMKSQIPKLPTNQMPASMSSNALYYQTWLYHTMSAARYYQLFLSFQNAPNSAAPKQVQPGTDRKDPQSN